MAIRQTQNRSIVVVGAGISGICCALHLQERGVPVVLLEADDTVGGRMRSDRVDGFTLDRGFQVLLTAYPEVQQMLDLDALRLGSFAPGAMIRTGERFARIADPFRRPREILRTLFSGVATPLDALRIARLRRRVSEGAALSLLDGPSREILTELREAGFSARIVDKFFRPFFAGVLLDREVVGSSRALSFFFRMFAEGDASLPAEGMSAIPAQLAARLEPGTLRTGTRVKRLDPSGATLASGERIHAAAVVVATSARVAGSLIPGLSLPDVNPAYCLHFDAERAPDVGDFLVLNGNRAGPVNELCVPSQVAPSYAPAGRALVSASVLGPAPDDDEALEHSTRQQLEGWFGPEVGRWRLLRIDRIPDALPAQPPGAFEPGPRQVQLTNRLFICGDHRDVASLQGAMASGRRAAMGVHRALQ
jgi:phytoene dehydrogenase-like protein